MTTAADPYALARNVSEYERLRAQARVWEPATARLLDHVGLGRGARCLDAGCGPGETMRLMAERVGPSGSVTGVDVDAALGADAIARLHASGHAACDFAAVDLTAGEPIPGAPFDLVYARLLLYHLPARVSVLERLWDAVAPRGVLLIQDYDVRPADVLPPLESVTAWREVVLEAFEAAGADVYVGSRLPELFGLAGIGVPDGTDVAGRLEPFATAGPGLLTGVLRGVLDAAIAYGITTAADAAALQRRLSSDAERFPQRPTLWPLLVGAWKRKPAR
jgi:SAM-dependent methyltransferase